VIINWKFILSNLSFAKGLLGLAPLNLSAMRQQQDFRLSVSRGAFSGILREAKFAKIHPNAVALGARGTGLDYG
jgi:hypothetical protein